MIAAYSRRGKQIPANRLLRHRAIVCSLYKWMYSTHTHTHIHKKSPQKYAAKSLGMHPAVRHWLKFRNIRCRRKQSHPLSTFPHFVLVDMPFLLALINYVNSLNASLFYLHMFLLVWP